MLLILIFIAFLTACTSTAAPVNTAAETPAEESPAITYIAENTPEPETELKTGTYAYDRGIYTKRQNFNLGSDYFRTGELYVIDRDNLLFAVLDMEKGSVKEKTELPVKGTAVGAEDWQSKFEKDTPLEDARFDGFKRCLEYKISDSYNLYLMDGELWLGILDLESAKTDDFSSVIKLKLQDESTEIAETLKVSHELLSYVSKSIEWSKGRYCQIVNIKADNYTQDYDGQHISASFTLTLSWNYEGYDNPNSFNYGRTQRQSIYELKAEAYISGGYIDHQSLIISASASGGEWTDISYREDMRKLVAADVEGALDETPAKKLYYNVTKFACADISIGPDMDVGEPDSEAEGFYIVSGIRWQTLRAYTEIEIPEGHYIRLTAEDGDTLTFYEETDIARYTSGAETEYYHTGVMLYEKLINWALRNKDRIFISEELAAKIYAGKNDTDPVTAYAWSMIEESALAGAKNSVMFADGTYFTDAEITRLKIAESYDGLIDGAVVELWTLHYALEAEDISKIMLAGGMSLDEKGWLTNTESMGRRCPVVINRDGVREGVGAVYYLGYRGYALGGIRELFDNLGITGGWFKSFYDSLTPELTYADKGKADRTVTLTDEETAMLWNTLSGYELILYEGMIAEEQKDGVLWLSGLDYGIEFICGKDLIIVHDGYDSTLYGTIRKDRGGENDLAQAVLELYKSKR
jgi:hypothetical protein